MFTPIGCSWIGLMRRRAAVAAVVLATAVVLAARPITAQSGDGAIAGVVKDGTGAALPGVTMTITSLDRGTISAATHTAADGSYTAVALPPGTYSVTAELSGFTKQEVKPLTLRIADRLHVDVILGLASLAETVTVTGHSETILRRDTSSLAETITPEQVKQLPLFARNPMNLVQLVGGVAGGTDVEGSLATAQLSINGSRTANTEVTIDGVSAVVGSTGDITFIPSVEALQEFKVQTSSYSSEYGRTSGGTISAIVQSGTSRFKGSTYGYFRDAKFNANNYFNQSRGIAKPADRFKQFGASIGGPVKEISSGTFFFFNYEGLRRTVPRQFTSTLPTDALRKGDLSGFATPIIDPATGAQVRDPSRATPGNPLGLNIIPAGRIDPAAQAIIGSLPLPNQPGLSNNYVTTSEDSVDLNQFNTRIDHSIGTAARLSGRYSQQTGVNPGFTGDASTIIPGPMNPGTGANHPVDRQLSLNYSQTIGSSLVHEATVGANLNKQTLNPPGVIDSPSTLGFTRAPQLPFDGNSGYYAPAIQFAGGVNWGYGANRVQQLGMNANALRRQNTTTWQIGDSVTWIHAAHTVKGGGQIRFNKLDIFNGGAAFAGIYTISGDMLPGAPSSSQATEWAALLFGLVESAQYAIPQPETVRRNRNYAAFLQDDWKPTGRLTLNLGLRWEYESPLTIDGNVYSRIDQATGKLLVAGVNASNSLNLVADKANLAPRVGMAWTLNDKTVLRAAYGKFYSQFFSNLGGSGALYPGFTTNVQFQRRGPGLPQAFALGQGMPLTGVPGTSDPFAAERNASPNQPLSFGAGWASISPLPHTHLWNIGIERELAGSFGARADYVGSHGSNLPLDSYDFNAVPLAQWDAIARAGSAATTQLTRPFPNVNTLNEFTHDGRSNYHSAQFSVRRQFRDGLGILTSYTLSRSKDDGSGIFNFSQPNGLQRGLIPTFNRDLDYGLSAFDRTHVFTGAANYELPWGDGKRWLSGQSVARAVLGGFSLNALASARSGLPATITETGIGNLPLSNPRPNQNGDLPTGITPGPNGTVRWFPAPGDPDFPFTPVGPLYTGSGAARRLVLPVGIGDVGRNTVRGPAEYNVDLSLVRRFRVGRDANLNARVEMFNVFNHTNFQLDPAGATTTLPVQVVNGQAQFVAPNFGLITSALPARRMQFVLRLDF
jgi:outer membrane receptor protein involved in Fe transport